MTWRSTIAGLSAAVAASGCAGPRVPLKDPFVIVGDRVGAGGISNDVSNNVFIPLVLGVDALVGKTVSDGVDAFGEGYLDLGAPLTFDREAFTTAPGVMTGLGAGVITRVGGMHAGASGGAAVLALQSLHGRAVTTGAPVLRLRLGNEWWVSDSFAFGFALVGTGALAAVPGGLDPLVTVTFGYELTWH